MIDEAQSKLQVFQRRSSELEHYMQNVSITTKADELNYADILTILRNSYKQADEERKNLIAPIREAESRINRMFKPYLDKIKGWIEVVAPALSEYRTHLKQTAEQQLDTVALDYVKRLQEAKVTGEVVELPALPDLNPSNKLRTNVGSANYRTDWDIRIVDEKLIPRDLCQPVMSLIRKRVESGITDIPGVIATKKYTLITRLAK